jgi:hypothetical protein
MTLQFTRVVADENVPKEVVELLKGMDFKEVYWILERKPGISDTDVWRIATEKTAVLITGDLRLLPQLAENQVIYGPDILEYSTKGFTKNELQDAQVMSFLMKWIFSNGHHRGREHLKLRIEGTVKTRRQLRGQERLRRRRRI